MDILRNGKKIIPSPHKKSEFEIRGLSANGDLVCIHIREEQDQLKDKKLFFVSCYYRQAR